MSSSEVLSRQTLEECRKLIRCSPTPQDPPLAPGVSDAEAPIPASAPAGDPAPAPDAVDTAAPTIPARERAASRQLAAWLDRARSHSGALAFCFYFALIAAVLSGGLYAGFVHDESGYVAPVTTEFAAHPLKPYPLLDDPGHPMIYAWLVGVLWRLFGPSRPLAYLSIWFFGALALLGMHRLAGESLGRDLTPLHRRIGPVAALALFVTPTFVGCSAQYLDPIPFLAFNLWALVAWHRGQRGWLAFWLTLLTLTRLPGCLAVLGLGLFDAAWTLARRRGNWVTRLRGLAGAMVPYAISAAMLGLYLGIKLIVLKRPLSTFAVHTAIKPSMEIIQQHWSWMRVVGFDYPRYSFALMLAAAGGEGLVRFWCWLSRLGFPARPAESADVRPAGESAWDVLLAMTASMLPLFVLYLVHPLFPQPRWFLNQHALLILLGLHGLLCLPRRAWPLTGALLLAWGAMQGVRWHAGWLEALVPGKATFPMIPITTETLDIWQDKQAYLDCADQITATSRNPLIICGYPTVGSMSKTINGFFPYRVDLVDPLWLGTAEKLEEFLKAVGPGHDRLILLTSSLDVAAEQQLASQALAAHPELKLVRTFAMDRDNWLKYYVAPGKQKP